MLEHGLVPEVQTVVSDSGCHCTGDTGGSGSDGSTLGSTEVGLHDSGVALVHLKGVGRDLVSELELFVVVVGCDTAESAVPVVDDVDRVVDVILEDVVGVGCSCVLGESDSSGHVSAEVDLVVDDGSEGDGLEDCAGGVVRVDTVGLYHIVEESEGDSSGLVGSPDTPCGHHGSHVDGHVFRGVCEVSDGCLSCCEFVGGDESHGDLHCSVPGDGCSIHHTADHGRNADSLHDSLSDCLLQLLSLVLGEVLVDVDDESGVQLVDQLVVSGEDLDVGVVNECGVALCHVLLNDCSSRHGVVDGLEVRVDGLGGDFLSKPSLDGLVGGVESDEDGPPDVVPSLLDGRVVDAVEVIGLYEDVGVGQLVGHPGPLS